MQYDDIRLPRAHESVARDHLGPWERSNEPDNHQPVIDLIAVAAFLQSLETNISATQFLFL